MYGNFTDFGFAGNFRMAVQERFQLKTNLLESY